MMNRRDATPQSAPLEAAVPNAQGGSEPATARTTLPELKHPMAARTLVMASAGTGKTYVLSTRLITALLRGHDRGDPAGILATTFTRKAAGEILGRVFGRLLEAADKPVRLADLAEQTATQLDAGACVRVAADLARRMDRLRIMTLDALMGTMARASTTELDVWPAWTIGSESDDADARRRAIDAALGDDPEGLRLLLRGLAKRPFTSNIHASLERLVKEAHAPFLNAGADPGIWSAIGPTGLPLEREEVAHAIKRLLASEVPQTKQGKPNQNFLKAIVAFAQAVKDEQWEALATAGLGKALLTTGRYYSTDLPAEMADALRPLVDHAVRSILSDLRERNTAAADLLRRFDEHLCRMRRSTGVLAFDDIPRLLVEAEVNQRLGDLWYRLDAGLDTLLIDEAQDTSLIQYRLIDPILGELASGGDRGVLIVGDVKQSLYAWRQAEPMLLPAVGQRWATLDQRSLSTSHRSSPVVLGVVNDVFASISANAGLGDRAGVLEAGRSFQELFITHRAADTKADMPGQVILRTLPQDPESDTPKGDPVAGSVAAVVELLEHARATGVRPSVGVLVRENKWIRPIVAALQDAGIDASQEGGSPLTDDPVVAVVLSLLHLGDHPADTLAAFHIATSPLAPLLGWNGVPAPAQARRVAAKVRRRLVARGYAEVIERVLARLGPAIPDASLERLDQFLALAREFDEQPSLRPTEFIALVEARRVARASPAQVRVMTIHAAKGLEFDAVVLPNLETKWSSRDKPLFNRAHPLATPTAASVSIPRELAIVHPDLAAMIDQRDQRDAFEQLCTLYVAMTRSRRALVMLIDPFEPPRKGADAPTPRASLVLRRALAPSADHADPGEVLFVTGQATGWCRDLEAIVPTPTDPASAPASGPSAASASPPPAVSPISTGPIIRLAPPDPRSLRRAPVVAPSSLEGAGLIDLAQRLASRPAGAAEVGTIAHAMLARLDWLDDAAPTREHLTAIGMGVPAAQPSAAEHAADIVLTALATPASACLRRAWHHDTHRGATLDLRQEWPFLSADAPTDAGSSRLLSGTIDRLVIARDATGRPLGADILDFKTDRLDGRDDLTTRVEHYRPQLAAYTRAVALGLGLPPDRVRAWLVFLSAGSIARV